MNRSLIAITVLLLSATLPGCVRRTLTVRTEPEGAAVWINNEQAGKSPASVDFTWYGDYDIACRKKGYEPLWTHHRINAPWYQLPGIDFFAEVLTPWTYEDHHVVQFELETEELPSRVDLIERAQEMRERALFAEE